MRVTQFAGIVTLAGAAAAATPGKLAAQVQTAAAATPAAAGPPNAPHPPADTAAAAPAAAPAQAPPLPAGLRISGFAEASYAWSSKPAGPARAAIAGRLYDRFHDQFTLNALKVAVERPFAADKFDAGFRADVILGENATVLHSSGLTLGDQGDLTQLFVTLNVPTPNGNGVQLKLGKMATLLGFEVIDDPANPNWSVGNLFNFVENFTAVGLSAEYRFSRRVDAQLRMIDGWDVVQDNNRGHSVMGRVGLTPDARSSVAFVGYFGPEAAASSAKRYGAEVLASRKLSDRVAASVQADYGREERLVPGATAVSAADGSAPGVAAAGPATTADWWGAGAWVTVDLAPSVQAALRGDVVDDRHGVRSNGFLFPAFADGPGTRHRFGSATATLNVKTWANVFVRPELRYDRSNLPVFGAKRDQVTAAFSIAYLY